MLDCWQRPRRVSTNDLAGVFRRWPTSVHTFTEQTEPHRVNILENGQVGWGLEEKRATRAAKRKFKMAPLSLDCQNSCNLLPGCGEKPFFFNIIYIYILKMVDECEKMAMAMVAQELMRQGRGQKECRPPR